MFSPPKMTLKREHALCIVTRLKWQPLQKLPGLSPWEVAFPGFDIVCSHDVAPCIEYTCVYQQWLRTTCIAGDTRDIGLIPESGGFP